MRIGVLALQGAFIEHEQVLHTLGVDTFQIRQLSDLDQPFDGLVLPGGESTVMRKLLDDLGLFAPLKQKIKGGLPVFGTCAGAILLAKSISNEPQPHFAEMDIAIERNAYGRQLGSFIADEKFSEDELVIPMSFIRAPIIRSVSGQAIVMAKVGDDIVAAREGNKLVTTFHPELKTDVVHRYFLQMIKGEK